MKISIHQFLVCVLLFAFTLSVNAQKDKNKLVANLKGFDEKPVHFGFLIGLNTMNFNILHSGASTPENGDNPRYAEMLSLQPGINLGIVTSFRLRKNLSLRILPGISFGQRDLTFIDSNGVQEDEPLQIKSTFIEAPIMIKYGGDRNHNFKPYIVAGINTRCDLAKKKQSGILLNAFDFYYEVGAGFDSYLNYFRLSTELKISVGMSDVLNHEGTGDAIDLPYTQAIDRLTSRIFVLSFYFE
ncbi:type IX secretion/gliding motility protein PorT/SprT [Labilibacter marinus]|uniref:type IX secretion/gliding motility protein PorT/SprT n=1 Tax=Labilibacter marinus TaxID=1477105 RepID=UPI000832D93F|nr:outer membrane beta-barrel protein [Labilibacter marinus]